VTANAARPRLVFVDRLVPASLLRLLWLGRAVEEVWYFDPPSAAGRRWLAALRAWRLLAADPRPITDNVGRVRDTAGEISYAALLRSARELTVTIKTREVAGSPLIDALDARWSAKHLALYFEKLAEAEVTDGCLRIALAEWMARSRRRPDAETILVIRRRQWFPYLEAWARERNVRLIGYRTLGRDGGAGAVLRRWATRAVRLAGFAVRARRRGRPAGAASATVPRADGISARATVAVRYWGRPLSFDPCERSEFFWLEPSGIPAANVVLYGYTAQTSLDPVTREGIDTRGIAVWGDAPGIPRWRGTRALPAVAARAVLAVARATLGCWLRGRRISAAELVHTLRLALEYAYWYDFYAANKIRLHVAPTFSTTVAQAMALADAGAVSVAYQYSMTNVLAASSLLTAGEDVQFVFSPFFERLWRSVDAPVGRLISSGFVYDAALQALREGRPAATLRRELEKHGATFILCFFDENARPGWDAFLSETHAWEDYEFLLRWVLDDPTIAVVFKPKNSAALGRRLRDPEGLVERARATARCVFLTDDTFYGRTFPAEVALAADLSIGKLMAVTAAFEARLAGARAVCVDTEELRDHPFYRWTGGRVVFERWEDLRAAVERYRANPREHDDLGDWGAHLHDLETFRDGKGTARLGAYLGDLHGVLDGGASAGDALRRASEHFARRWRQVGREAVVSS
jgi:hypothetical protein